ncbi:MAG: DUF433 domain-containing protein [Streptosporangiales bacterium]|nr:DUF433 domain-containing protein [Streptosporangiales bacterium]
MIAPSQRLERPRLYSFPDLRDLCVAQNLRRQGARPGEIKAVVQFLRELAGPRKERLAQAELAVVGGRVVYRNRALGIEPLEPSMGQQRTFSVSMAKIFDGLGVEESGELRELRPADRVVINPRVRGGTPVIEGTRVPTRIVAELVDEAVSADEILNMYPSLTPEDVDAAVSWEGRLRTAAAG